MAKTKKSIKPKAAAKRKPTSPRKKSDTKKVNVQKRKPVAVKGAVKKLTTRRVAKKPRVFVIWKRSWVIS